MKSLFVYLKNYIKECVMGPLFKLLEASFELLVPLVVADIIDKGIVGADKSYIISRVFILILLAVVGFTCSVTAQFFAAKAATGFATELRHSLFAHIQKLSFTEIDEMGKPIYKPKTVIEDIAAIAKMRNSLIELEEQHKKGLLSQSKLRGDTEPGFDEI